jgi:VanZ family protein
MKNKSMDILSLIGGILSVAVGITIVILSLLPSEDLGDLHFTFAHADKLAHALAYAAFGFFLHLALVPTVPRENRPYKRTASLWRFLLVLSAGFLLGALMEVIQPVFERGLEIADLFADVLGTIVGYFIAVPCLWVRAWFEKAGRS